MKMLKENWGVWFVLLLTCVLRLPLLSGSFWLDEAAQALESARPFSEQLAIAGDFQPPLLHYIVHFAMYLGREEQWLRIWGALLPGIITVIAVWWLGTKWFNKTTGFIASMLLASNSFHIFYSQELRPYSLPTMFVLLSWVCVTKLFENPKQKSMWFWWSISSLLGWYSSYIYPFFWVVQVGVILFVLRKQIRNVLVASAVTVAGFLPWVPSLLEQLRVGSDLQKTLPGWSDVVGTPWLKSLPLTAAKLVFGVLDLSFSPAYLVTAGLVAFLTLFLVWNKKTVFLSWGEVKKNPYTVLPVVWLVLPLIVTWVVSLIIPVLQPKRVLFLWPAFSLFMAQLVTPHIENFLAHKKMEKSWVPGMFLAALLFGTNTISTGAYWTTPALQREDWRSMIKKLESLTPPDKTVAIFAFPAPFAPWVWYASPEIDTLSTGTLSVGQIASVRDFVEPVNQYEYVVTFEYLQQLSDPNKDIEQTVSSYQYKDVYLLDYPLIGFTRVWTKQANTLSDAEL
jgi:uncharacterized membrane protein